MITLSGRELTLEVLEHAVRPGAVVALSNDGLARMASARALIDAAIQDGHPVYGVTTGLGSRATEALPADRLADFSLETLNGRAQSTGSTLPPETVRGAMLARMNSFLLGASGAHPEIARHMAAVFNAGLTPRVREFGSIGAADLLLGAEMGRAVLGLGGMLNNANAGDALRNHDLTPPALGPRDGLALANHACFSAAEAALAALRALRSLRASRAAIALSILGFQGNVTPLDPAVLALKGHDADHAVATDILARLDGADIIDPSNARRLQDPVSLRNAVQSLGAAEIAAAPLRATIEAEINGSSDNPAVLIEDGRILSTGNYFTPHLTLACDTMGRGLASVGVMIVARLAKHCAARLSDLPGYLADPEEGSNGFAPLLKLAEGLLAELQHAATPIAPWPSVNADGVEDGLTLSFHAARRLRRATEAFSTLLSLEFIVAAQAVDLRKAVLPKGVRDDYTRVRDVSPYVAASRPLGDEIAAIAAAVRSGDFA